MFGEGFIMKYLLLAIMLFIIGCSDITNPIVPKVEQPILIATYNDGLATGYNVFRFDSTAEYNEVYLGELKKGSELIIPLNVGYNEILFYQMGLHEYPTVEQFIADSGGIYFYEIEN